MSFVLPTPGQFLTMGSPADEDPDLRAKLGALTERFQGVFARRVDQQRLPALVVRARLPFNASYITDRDHLWIVGDVARGMPFLRVFYVPDQALTESNIEQAARQELGYDDPFFVKIPRSLVDASVGSEEEIERGLERAADELIAREYHRFVASTQTIRLRPLFGDPPFQAKPNVCFVIAPFSSERTQIYQEIIKPIVEANELACLRADDLRKNRAIIQNIWQSICEARFLIADLTSANPNVFYELGVARTVGKEVILIEERPLEGEPPKRVFDTMGIDAILYERSPIGGQRLRNELDARIKAALSHVLVATDQT